MRLALGSGLWRLTLGRLFVAVSAAIGAVTIAAAVGADPTATESAIVESTVPDSSVAGRIAQSSVRVVDLEAPERSLGGALLVLGDRVGVVTCHHAIADLSSDRYRVVFHDGTVRELSAAPQRSRQANVTWFALPDFALEEVPSSESATRVRDGDSLWLNVAAWGTPDRPGQFLTKPTRVTGTTPPLMGGYDTQHFSPGARDSEAAPLFDSNGNFWGLHCAREQRPNEQPFDQSSWAISRSQFALDH